MHFNVGLRQSRAREESFENQGLRSFWIRRIITYSVDYLFLYYLFIGYRQLIVDW